MPDAETRFGARFCKGYGQRGHPTCQGCGCRTFLWESTQSHVEATTGASLTEEVLRWPLSKSCYLREMKPDANTYGSSPQRITMDGKPPNSMSLVRRHQRVCQ